ncbi:MAG: FtsQ-type POTRA domain-containing protein [Alphaproteobacteria bacterium]|nr:FtsQ-type POTRA domain-containing protein [Alphaproteobacteria bacterium]
MRFLKRRAASRIKAPRRRVAPRWLKPALKGTAAALVIGGIGFGAGWLWRAGLIQHAAAMVSDNAMTSSAAVGLKVDDVLVVGRAETPRADVLAAIGAVRGMPIFAIDPTAAKARLEQLPWVRMATVERRLPGTVFVRLAEREPIALWQSQGRLQLVDREGTAIAVRDVENFGHLPIVVGDDAPAHTPALLAMLAAEPDMASRVGAAVRVGQRRWNLLLDNGIELRLPETDAGRAWAWVANLEREHRVLARDVTAIDLRLPDRLVVRLAPDAERTALPSKPTRSAPKSIPAGTPARPAKST